MSPEQKGDGSDWVRGLREAAPYLSLGTSLAVTVLLGVALGYWADQTLGTQPWLLLLGAVSGLALAIYQFFRTVSRR
ncbi:MAG TPA: AtpZ/AtpI family protein [Vicinamibacteria bacterium]|nr:AtpZ/AtpI family protein [Vicinamibacteria bacterium]